MDCFDFPPLDQLTPNLYTRVRLLTSKSRQVLPLLTRGREWDSVKSIMCWRPLALFGLALLGFALRLYGLNWDAGNSFHPDERQILFRVEDLAWPQSLAQFFDPMHSPLNPHFFAYGSFPLYLLALVGHTLAHIFPTLDTFSNFALIGRVISALFDTGTVLLTGWLALLLVDDTSPERRHAWNVALLAAALVAFTPFQLQLAHFYTVDTILLFFVMLTVVASVKLVDTDAPIRWSLVVGLAYGLALATKISAFPLGIAVCVALLMRWRRRNLFSSVLSLAVSAATTCWTLLIAMPYALLDWQEFIDQVKQQGSLAQGTFDLPYVRQFAGTTPYIYEIQNMLLWGLGLMLGLAACAGLLWLLWRVWKRTAGPWMIVLSWVFVYAAITGSFYVKFMRYMLPIYPLLTLMAAALLMAFVRYASLGKAISSDAVRGRDKSGPYEQVALVKVEGSADLTSGRDESGPYRYKIQHWAYAIQNWMYTKRVLRALSYATIVLVLGGTIFQGLALLNVYSQPNTRVQASRWIYSHLKPGSVLTFEQWDDPLPVAINGNDPSIYQQASYLDANGQAQQGLDLYSEDTIAKAQQLANLLPTLNAITMPTDRLDKSIPRLPFRYPLTIHYYQLLFSEQLGFHLAAQFENHPSLFGITLDDSGADESYSVFDHPTARIFMRDNPYHYTSNQLFQKLLQGVQLPAPAAELSGTQHSLLLTPQQIADDQQSPPFGVQFPLDSFSNAVPIFVWWLTLLLLGIVMFPLLFLAFRALRDRGYVFSKVLGLLVLAYLAWLLASTHVLAFSRLSLLFVLGFLLLSSIAVGYWQRRTLLTFLRVHLRLLLLEEGIFTLIYLLFVGIRSLNPDLWHPYMGGEKPQELAFLNAVLRSSYMPPLDPWFAGGYINYYYYGYVLVGALCKLTGIAPTMAFNLAIPTLCAFTFTGIVALLYSLTRRFSAALLGGYFAVLIGNFNGLIQFKAQLSALLAHLPIPPFDYWQSSRIIPFTINEFPFWSFLFADLHPHVIDLPIAVLMLGIIATLLLSGSAGNEGKEDQGKKPWSEKVSLYLLAAFVFGTIACVNTWDMPVYALLLAVALLIRTVQQRGQKNLFELLISLGLCLVTIVLLCGLGYLFYWPFYASYQQLYVNGLGSVSLGTRLSDYLTVFGLWAFIALSFFLLELYRWWTVRSRSSRSVGVSRTGARRVAGYLLLCGVVLTFVLLLQLKTLLVALIALGVFLLIVRGWRKDDPLTHFTYLLLLMGLCISLGQEIVYVRDFLDGGDYERMNTVFKFSMQAWLCFAIGGALAVQRLWTHLSGVVKRVWSGMLIVLVLGCSLFLPLGTASRINDHQTWIAIQAPVQSADYLPTLDGFASVKAWFPADAKAIAWLNANIAGSPVVLEAAAPVSYQWYNRVSVYTGLPDVLGWPDHVGEQRYDYQPLNRVTDIGIIYSTPDSAQALELLRYYHVRYIYVGPLERQTYAQQSSIGLDKFNRMVGSSLRIVYNSDGVTIYEVV